MEKLGGHLIGDIGFWIFSSSFDFLNGGAISSNKQDESLFFSICENVEKVGRNIMTDIWGSDLNQ